MESYSEICSSICRVLTTVNHTKSRIKRNHEVLSNIHSACCVFQFKMLPTEGKRDNDVEPDPPAEKRKVGVDLK